MITIINLIINKIANIIDNEKRVTAEKSDFVYFGKREFINMCSKKGLKLIMIEKHELIDASEPTRYNYLFQKN